MELSFSFIIPVYNRPHEIRELFESMCALTSRIPFEVVLVEDGSTLSAGSVVDDYKELLSITYLPKQNTGPGSSRNYGMRKAGGNYFIILDSDCLLPPEYLQVVSDALEEHYVDCFGGPDTAHQDFTPIQKAINFSMTSVLTTGGIRGGLTNAVGFQPRSFNMGLSRQAFEETGGFGNIHPGEDPDLSIRLRDKGYETRLIPGAYVYHKRRIDFKAFYRQMKKFGMVRPILNHWHPKTRKITYWFPSCFIAGLVLMVLLAILAPVPYGYLLAGLYSIYFFGIFTEALLRNRSLGVALLAVLAVLVQFTAYGLGFLKSTFLVTFSKREPSELFPELFF
jgi:glycosyltransferase involved in cell wall biosynthesis